MDPDLDDQQRELRDTARRFLEREAGTTLARAALDDAAFNAEDLWKQIAALGWPALTVAEEHDGLGLGLRELALLLAEMGRVVLPGPYLATVACGASAIQIAGSDEQKARLLPRIADGSLTSTLAHDGHVDARDGRLFGERRFVLDGDTAEQVVVIAHLDDDSPGFFIAEPTERTPIHTMDGTRRFAHLRFEGAEGELLDRTGIDTLRPIVDRILVAIAADSLGGAERVLELAVDYAKQREQFGKPIGSFQAIKHRLADMHVDVESLRVAVGYAAWAVETGAPDASRAAAAAKVWAADAYRRVAQGGIQVHGGIGFTWEHDMHLYFKRAKSNEFLFGGADFHRERVARMVHD